MLTLFVRDQSPHRMTWTGGGDGVTFALANDWKMKLLQFTIEREEDSGSYTAWWDDPKGGGITTQAKSLAELPQAIDEAVRCHFREQKSPRQVALHFKRDPILELA